MMPCECLFLIATKRSIFAKKSTREFGKAKNSSYIYSIEIKVMKVEKSVLTPKWLEIKAMYEANTNGSKEYGENFPIDGEFDELTQHFIGMLGAITLKSGFDAVVEGVKMDLWKERIWSVVENAGLLPNIAWKDELEMEEIRDTWNDSNDEFDYDFESRENEAYGC